MNILAIDTASDILCIALRIGDSEGKPGKGLELSIDDGLRHAELLMEAIDQLCGQADLPPHQITGIVCAKGPGSFTGLRIGMATAKGLATALGCPLCSVSSLDAIARRHRHWPGLVIPLFDARKQRFYGGAYLGGERVSDYFDLACADILPWLKDQTTAIGQAGPILWTGPDARLWLERWHGINPNLVPSAAEPGVIDSAGRKGWAMEMVELGLMKLEKGQFDPPEAGPEYVRVSDAELGITRKSP